MLATFMSTHGWTHEGLAIPENLPALIQTDSRKVEAGQWFVPIVGENHDGHVFVEGALKQGAAGFLYARSRAGTLSAEAKKRGIAVDDTYQAVQHLAQWWRAQMKNCQVIGITGSSGKTSVKELCAAMLEALAPTLKTEGSLNNELGVPLTLLRLKPEHRFAVIEMGARHKGDIAFLSGIVQQNVGVLINVGTAHVGEFGGTEKILEAKMEIAAAPKTVYFRDDDRIHQAMKALSGKTSISFGRHPEADVRILKDSCSAQGELQLTLNVKGQDQTLTLPYFHDAYAVNVATVLAISLSLGLSAADCLKGLGRFQGVRGRFQIHRLPTLTVIDDAYNANPQSMKAGLETVKKAFPASRSILILGDMRELGQETESAHRQIGAYAAKELKPSLLVTVGDSSQFMRDAAREAGQPAQGLLHYPDVDALLTDLEQLRTRGDLLYVKASNSLKLSKIVDRLLTV